MATTYRDWLASLLPAPIAGPWGRAWAMVQGVEIDGLLTNAKLAVKAGFVGLAPADALPYHGRDRQIPRLTDEAWETYRARLAGAWETWSWATTEYGVREAVVLADLGSPTFYPDRDFPRAPLGRGWWSRFTVVFSGRVTFDGLLEWDDGDSEWDGRHLDPIEALTDITARRQLRTLLRTWKSARDRVTSVIVARGSSLYDLSADVWDDELTWDEGGTVTELASETWDDGDELAWDDADPAHVFDYLL